MPGSRAAECFFWADRSSCVETSARIAWSSFPNLSLWASLQRIAFTERHYMTSPRTINVLHKESSRPRAAIVSPTQLFALIRPLLWTVWAWTDCARLLLPLCWQRSYTCQGSTNDEWSVFFTWRKISHYINLLLTSCILDVFTVKKMRQLNTKHL